MKKNALIALFAFAIAGVSLTSCSDSDDAPVTQDPIVNPNPDPNPDPNPNPNPTAKFQHKVLLEDITGTWCPACPIASDAIKQAKQNSANGDKVVAAVIHIGRSDYPDPMEFQRGYSLYTSVFVPKYGSGGSFSFPTVAINRGVAWNQQGIAPFFNAINQQGSDVGIKINSELTTTGGNITATFKFNEGYENLKYNVYVIEQGVVTNSPQAGTAEGANYVHYDVLRAISGTISGNVLGNVTAGQEIVKSGQNVEYTLFNNDLSKVEVVVFVTDSSGKVLNVQVAPANTAIEYQMLN